MCVLTALNSPCTVESFPFMFMPLQVRSWLHPFLGHCEQKTVQDEGLLFISTGHHPLLNRRCARLPGCICLQNDLSCVGWGIVKLYSLAHSLSDYRCNLFVCLDLGIGHST